MIEECELFRPESVYLARRVDSPPFQHIPGQGLMRTHRTVAFEGDQVVVEQCVNMRRQQDAVVAADPFGVAG